MLISVDFLKKIGVRGPEQWAGPLSASCAAQGITTGPRIAAFLANGLCETQMLTKVVENLNYTPSALLAQWPNHFPNNVAQAVGRTIDHPADQFRIAEYAYGGRYGNGNRGTGDGWRYRGHGLFNTTFKANYLELAKSIGWRDSIEALPTFLETPTGACTSAVLYWQSRNCNLYADHGDIAGVRRLINGGLIGLPIVRLFFQNIFGNMSMVPTVETPTESLNQASLAKARAQ